MPTIRTMTEYRSAATRAVWKSVLQAALIVACLALLHWASQAPFETPLLESLKEFVQEAVPPFAGIMGLIELALFLVIVVCCFGHCCLMQAVIYPADFAILSRLRRMILLPFAVCRSLVSPIRLCLAKTSGPLPIFSSRRTASPTAAALAGAAPLLI